MLANWKGPHDLAREREKMPRDVEDLERVRSALRSGAQPVQVEMRDAATRRALRPAIVVYEADGAALELAKNGRVTKWGRLWDQERVRSRSPLR